MIITIDGTAGSGKSSISEIVAESLGMRVVDTGKHYRAVTKMALRHNIDLKDKSALTDLAGLEIKPTKEGGATVGAEKFSHDDLHTSKIDDAVPIVAAVLGVRKALQAQQIKQAGDNAVVNGRDSGSLFPDAAFKYFITATATARASRRDHSTVQDLLKRDNLDASRKIDPLKPTKDAIIFDSTKTKSKQIAKAIVSMVRGERTKWQKIRDAGK